jgi:hypothetical protein
LHSALPSATLNALGKGFFKKKLDFLC